VITMRRAPSRCLLAPAFPLLAALGPSLAAAGGPEPFTVAAAIRRAWAGQAGLQAGQALVEGAQAEAEAQRRLRLPTLTVAAGLARTDEPMQAFGTRLDQARITAADFDPSRLNHPDPITGFGATVTVRQPLYAGGRLDAARRAGAALAGASAAGQERRRQEVALAVDQAYFGVQVAGRALAFAEDSLRQARENERFAQARVDQGLLLKSEGARTLAYRAQAEAAVAEARARQDSARSALALLVGGEVPEELATPLEPESGGEGAEAQAVSTAGSPSARGDLQAARGQAEAARQGVAAAEGAWKPEVGLELSAGTARDALERGGNWNSVALGARWTFSFASSPNVQAAQAAARAAELNLRWQEQQAGREVLEARRALETARARIAAARQAVAASESVRTLRTARHREGLLPLVEVLDAETALSGARTLLLSSELDLRLGRAQLALALGQPIEDVKE
jgi:outer membrane protein TolC